MFKQKQPLVSARGTTKRGNLMRVEYKSAEKKPFMQKAYEKFVMVFYSILGHSKKLDFEGVLSVMIGKNSDGQNDCYLGIETKTGFIPVAKFFHENDVKPECNQEMSHQVSELFYKMMGVETRRSIEDFNKTHIMPEFINLYPDADIK